MLHRSHVNVSEYVMNNAIQNINQAINRIGPINVLPNGHWTHCLEQRYILVSKPWTSAQAAQRPYFLWTFNQKALLYIQACLYTHAQARPFFFSFFFFISAATHPGSAPQWDVAPFTNFMETTHRPNTVI